MIARIAATLTLLVSLAACGGADGGDTSSRCLAVNQANLDAITGTLEDGTKVTKGAAVKSKDYESVYMVAARFGDQVGVWATNDDPTDAKVEGVLMAGDGFSQEFSSAPKGEVEDGADGIDEAKDCLG